MGAQHPGSVGVQEVRKDACRLAALAFPTTSARFEANLLRLQQVENIGQRHCQSRQNGEETGACCDTS